MNDERQFLKDEVDRLRDEVQRLIADNERLLRGIVPPESEVRLRQSEERFRAMFESHSAPMLLIEIKSGEIRRANAAAARFYGYSVEHLQKMTIQQINQSSELELARDRKRAAEQERNRFVFEHKLANGKTRIVEVHSSPLHVDDSLLLFSIIHDITERKQAERALAESELRYRTIIDASPLAIFVVRDDKYHYANRAAARQLGYPSPEDLIGMPMAQTIDPKDLPEVRRRFKQGGEGRDRGRNALMLITTIRADGTRGVTECTSVPIKLNDGSAILVMGQDITERLRDEAQLTLQALVLNQIADRVTITDLDGRITYVNDAECEIFKRSREELIGQSVETYGEDPEQGATQQEIIEATRKYGHWRGEVINYAADGSEIILDCRTQLVYSKEGEPIAMCGIATDITERKQIEQALRDSEQRYRGYVDNAPDGIFVLDESGRCLDVNPAACRMIGCERDELLGMDLQALLSQETADQGERKPASIVANSQFDGEIAVRRKDGEVVWWDLSATRLFDGRYLGFCKDITETRRLRQMESRAQRLETAGRIAGQVAHDFNNMLGPLMAYPELLRDYLPHDSEAVSFLEAIETAAQRMGEVNQQLLTLGRRAHYALEPLNLNALIRQVLSNMDNVPDTLTIETDLDDNLMNVLAGHAQLHRMIANIIRNARDACRDIGTITVTTRNFYVDEVNILYGRVPKGEYAKLSVADTGCGIPEHLLQSIFEPFVTSKTADKKRGSGLGLSVVDAVVKDHRGFLDLSTRVGEGTTFYVYLPVTREDVNSVSTDTIPEGSETLLVVDDDPTQRQLIRHLLERLGYRVTCAQSGEEAIDLLMDQDFDLMLLDMIMPDGIDGAETYRRTIELKPRQRALIVSGYSETERIHQAQRLGAGAYVRKPFSQRDIAAAVRDELDRDR